MMQSSSIRRSLYWLWTAAIIALFILHAPHLRADFPNNSPWMDYSKYTDEGWYGKAAIEHYVLGSWYVHGDFNPSVALPILPALELAIFHFTGVSLVAARLLILAVFGGNLLLVYFALRTQVPRWAALFALTLLSTNAFLYAFSRLAILEPLLILFLLASWLLALRLQEMAGAKRAATLVAIGLLICLMVLTKTTAIFLLPSTLFLICHACGYKLRKSLQAAAVVGLSAIVPFAIYYLGFVRPHYLADFHYLFAANEWDRPANLVAYISAFWYALHGILWIDPWLCGVAVALLLLAAIFGHGLYRNPLAIASVLAAAGYIFFTGWHNNMQPRYYQVVAYPVVMLIALSLHSLVGLKPAFSRKTFSPSVARWAAFAAVGVSTFTMTTNLNEIVYWTRHPQYSWITTASQLTRYIDQHPNGNRLLLSISGDNITLITHLPAICDDFGTWDLPFRIHTYQPGWYAAWNELDPGTLVDLQTQYSLERAATFQAFDDPDRNQLVLYKLHPLPPKRRQYQDGLEEQANAGK